MTLSRTRDGRHALTPRQAHLIGTLRRADGQWLELWELSRRAGYSIKITAANVRELRRLGIVVTRPNYNGLSTTEVSLAAGMRRAKQR
jgi:DNA-binding MarR family transcriptional regulator